MTSIIAAVAGAQEDGEERRSVRTITVATKDAEPFSFYDEEGAWQGISIELLERILEKREAAGHDPVEVEYVEAGLEELVDGLVDGRFDMSVAALTITAERARRIHFTYPFHTSGLGIAVPVTRGGRILGFVRGLVSPAFLKGVGALVLVLLIAGAAVWVFERRRNPAQFGGRAWSGLGSGFWWSAVTMTTVGYGDKAPITLGGRLVALVWMFAGVILISGFTAAIASTLTVKRLTSSITGPADLPGLRVATVADSTAESYLLGNRIAVRSFERIEEALQAAADGGADAVVYDAPLLRFRVGRDWSDRLVVLPAIFKVQHYAFGLPLESPWSEQIEPLMLETIEDPSWEELLTRYLGPRS